jgi:hypothetical protein
MVTDPIADLLTRVRNAAMARHDSVSIPASKMKILVAKILKDEGFVSDYSIIKGEPQRTIKITLKYTQGLWRSRHRGHLHVEGTDDRPTGLEEEHRRRSIMLCMVIELREVNLCLV